MVATLWRTRFRSCRGARRRGRKGFCKGRGGGGATQNRPSNVGERLYYTIESEIDNSSAGSSLHLLYPVCQSRRGVIGDAEYANCRRSTTRIYRGGWSPSRRPRVRIKAPLNATIVNAISIAATIVASQYPPDIVE